MSAQIFDPKAVSATQAVDASTWDWADEPPDTTTKAAESTTKAAESTTEAGESEERPRSQDDGATQREPKPKASEPAPRQSSDATFETRERDRGDRGRRDRRDHVEREERGGRGKAQRRDRAENDDFDEESFAEARRRRAERKAAKERAKQLAAEEAGPQTMLLPELISVANLGAALGIKPKEFIKQMAELGFEDISKDNILTGETAALIAQEYGFDAQVDVGDDEDLKPRPPPEDPSSLPLRPPVVTIMGHVDHGKTTLLDYLRKSSIVDQEHGGITQHIGAFSVTLSSGNPITFLDTPGHAAFLSMRQRGANVTDIVILVVAADDSVKPQTIEALKHARAAKVPMIVAINKVDKESANIDRVKSDLVAHGVEIEDYGGDVQVVCVSGKTGQGMQDLEENILLLAEMLDIRSETDGMAEGWVLESTIKPIGRVATVLVKRGTLRPGDAIVAGSVATRIRTLLNEAGQEVDEAPPGTAVEILGWKDPPAAGDQVLQAPSEDKAKRAAHYRQELKERHEAVALQNKQDQEKRDKAAAEELEKEMKEAAEEGAEEGASASTSGEAKESSTMIVNFIIKGDVHGSVEACVASVLAIGSNEVRPRVLLSGPGQITEWEVEHATISGSRIINFNNNIPGHIRQKAEEAGVKIMDHNIIYHMAEDVRDTLSGYLTPTVVTKVLGEVEILQIFQINVHGRVYKPIAGCKVRTGQVLRKAKVRVMRNGEEVFKGTIDALKQGKKTVTEVKKGSECGISFNGEWGDFRQGDIIQTIEEVAEKRHL
ncbi:translation initiation factor IF-2, mitochondrial [Podospora conica]|nr:translation initiation factor IF-2, mitochondrial [Schizothecium conicum]